jgi:hypothetical protein
MFREAGPPVSSCYNVMPLLEKCCSSSLLDTGIKDLLKEDGRLFG